jgi:hypothetical protein
MEDSSSDPKAILRQKLRDAILKQQWQGNMPGEDVNIPESNSMTPSSERTSQAGEPVYPKEPQKEQRNEELLKAIRMKMIEQDKMKSLEAQPPESGLDPESKARMEAYLRQLQLKGKIGQ